MIVTRYMISQTGSRQVGTGFSLYGRAQLDWGFEYLVELMNRGADDRGLSSAAC
jgi:hypothetical protein